MRDIHGNYHSLKEITANGPEWAAGCDKCKFGLVDAPPLTGVRTVLMERLAHMLLGMLQFCECKAGVTQEKHLTHKRFYLVNEWLRSPLNLAHDKRATSPDIEDAMHAVVKAMEAAPAPTIRFEGERVTA